MGLKDVSIQSEKIRNRYHELEKQIGRQRKMRWRF